MKKLSRGQKAWATRKANAKKKDKVVESLKEAVETQGLKLGDVLCLRFPKDYVTADGPALAKLDLNLTPYEQLDKVINDLEIRILNTVARIKSLGI